MMTNPSKYRSIVMGSTLVFSISLSIGIGKLKQIFMMRLKNRNTTKLKINFIRLDYKLTSLK